MRGSGRDAALRGGVHEGKSGLAEALKKAIPWGWLARPEDVARAVFLASDEAEYITGQTLSVSGGLTMV